MKFGEFAQHKFDVMVMTFLIVLFTSVILVYGHNSDYAGIVDWTEKGALGPLVGAVVYALQNRSTARVTDTSAPPATPAPNNRTTAPAAPATHTTEIATGG